MTSTAASRGQAQPACLLARAPLPLSPSVYITDHPNLKSVDRVIIPSLLLSFTRTPSKAPPRHHATKPIPHLPPHFPLLSNPPPTHLRTRLPLHPPTGHRCPKCNLVFCSHRAMAVHRDDPSHESAFTCTPCNATFATGSEWSAHEKTQAHRDTLAAYQKNMKRENTEADERIEASKKADRRKKRG